MAHVFCGVACLLATVWLAVEVLNASEANARRIGVVSWAAAVSMWLAFLIGGYWYVTYYRGDKAIILRGPWPLAHNYFMETKEHLVIVLLLAATYLPIAAANNLAVNTNARRLVLVVAAAVAGLSLLSEGHGAIIALGVKVALLARSH